ncbi:hypothetical protein THRCLA_00147 [Thraustotheca clavata]|uniref:BZIP domain-containing protein n=1 Tax=Thraustotheca clavata TaxID=74557 RepID=A0A1W0AC45_9STRA|nr:hypothetical protein THRCLA_00147 [Thraustotheca clavata]
MDNEVERKREHQLLRNRLKQRRHQKRFISARDELKAQIDELTAVLTSSIEHQRLPWKEVVIALNDATKDAEATRDELRRQYNETRLKMVAAMQLTSSLMQNPSMPPQSFAWVHTTLAADPIARKLGLDWFTQHMYHNTDRLLDYSNFPAFGDDADVLVRSCGNQCNDYLGRAQIEYPLQLEVAYSLLKERIWNFLRGDNMSYISEMLDTQIVSSIDTKMLYRRMPFSAVDSRYYVAREFIAQDRIVFLFGNFAQDALHPTNKIYRPRLFWFVLERTGKNRCRLRHIAYNGPYVVNDKVQTWLDEVVTHEALTGERLTRKQYQKHLEDSTRWMSQADWHAFSLKPDSL